MSLVVEKFLYYGSHPVVRSYAGTMLKMDVRKHEPFPQGAKIIAANHPSTTDPFFVAAMARQQTFILIKDILFQVPVLGGYLRRSGHIPVKAGQGQEAMDAALAHLAAGHTIMIFPEGDLSPASGGFLKARTGVARLAIASGAPVIPVGIHLLHERLRTIFSHINGKTSEGRWYFSGPYGITTGSPLRFGGDVENRDHVRSVADAVMHHIIELSHESQNRLTPAPNMHSAFEVF